MFRDVGQPSRVEMEKDDRTMDARSNSLVLAVIFWVLLSLSQAMIWFVIFPITVVWIVEDLRVPDVEVPWLGAKHTFNWHPLLMVIGFMVLAADATLVFRFLSRVGVTSRLVQKTVHGVMMAGSVVCVGVAFAAVYYYHDKQGYPHFQSMHSKLGLAATAHVGVQFIIGLIFYAFPCVPAHARRLFMPYHRYGGKAMLVLGGMAIVTGIQEQIGYEGAKNMSTVTQTALAIGMLIPYTLAVVLFLLGRDEFRRYQPPNGNSGSKSKDPSEKSLLQQRP